MNHHSIRLLFGLIILAGWLIIGSYRLTLAGPPRQATGQTYIVKAGDSLTRISANFYGDATRWSEIFAATNAKASEDNSFATIANARLIFPGQKLWIPALSADQPPPEAAPQSVAATPTEPPPAADSPITSEPNATAATQTPANPFVAAVRQLVGEADQAGLLGNAQSQSQLALDHLGFLQEALEKNDLPLARRHAEHLVNILEGEDGVLFGDNDRDGQTQNPGDGVGVRTYLDDAQTQAQTALDALADIATDSTIDLSAQQLVSTTVKSQTIAQMVVVQAFQIFAADSIDEIHTIAAALALQLNDLQANITNSATASTQLLALGEELGNQLGEELTSGPGDTADAALLPLRELLAAEGGKLTNAQSQTQLAREHLGFLQDALTQNDLPLARRHAEHVVNILEGEDGVLFGDNDRDGQTLNPGDGTGVYTYLVDTQRVLDMLDGSTIGGASIPQLRTATVSSQALVQTAAEKAFQLFAADSVDETGTIAAALEGLLNELETSITNVITSGSQLLTTRVSPPIVENEQLLPLRELLAVEGGVLTNAQSQSQLARDHLGFLQDALAKKDLMLARRHAEHIVNILEGEDGVLFGDNDRDGQTLNPGDGVGVRVYLANTQTQVQAVLGGLDEATLDTAIGASVQRFVASTARGQKLTQEAAEKALQIFAADTVPTTRAVAVEVELLLNELLDAVTATFTTGDQLFPK